jgi:DNA-binding SARP family transcriptional activator
LDRTTIGILGPLLVTDAAGEPCGLGGLNRRTLLATLLVEHNRVVPTDRLIDELWQGDPPRTARNALQVAVCQVRSRLQDSGLARDTATIETQACGYLLRLDRSVFDVRRFESELRQAAAAQTAGDLDAAVQLVGRALDHWRGPALSDVRQTPTLAAEARRLAELRDVVREERIAVELRRGRDGRLVGELYSLVAEHPLRERLHEYLMIVLHRQGRPAEALAVYARIRQALRDQLGLEPGPALRSLQGAVLSRAPAHAVPLIPAGSAAS